MEKSWKEVRVEIHPFLAEAASNFLIEQGSPGIVQEEVKGSSGRKRERLTAYFAAGRSFKAKKKKITIYLRSLSQSRRTSFALTQRTIREEKWAQNWQENFKPVEIPPRLVIKPPWEKWPEKKGQIIIEIDPGMAFGTGTHPSTQMCLRVLQDLIPSRLYPPAILDVGTGSGILAIASRKLGAKKVVAIDIDRVAIACARKNAAANRVGGRIDFRSGSVNSLRRVFDIAVANLLPQELLGLIPALSRRVASGGSLIASGFLGRQKKEIASALAKQGLEVQHSLTQKGWSCFLLAKGRKEDEA